MFFLIVAFQFEIHHDCLLIFQKKKYLAISFVALILVF